MKHQYIVSDADFGGPDPAHVTHRFRLRRYWSGQPYLVVIGLNPSTADAVALDPTVRRCVGYADQWGYGGLIMLNAFSLRSTDPAGLTRGDATDRGNMPAIERTLTEARIHGYGVLCAWGNPPSGGVHGRSYFADVLDWVKATVLTYGGGGCCLGRTAAGNPRHPLYMRADALPVPFVGDGGPLAQVRPGAVALSLPIDTH